MNTAQKKALSLIISMRKNMERFRDISKELLAPDESFRPSRELSKFIREQELLNIKEADNEQD